MKKAVRWLCLIFAFAGCGNPAPKLPLPDEHPAQGFYQTAGSFYVAPSSCSKLKGILDIRPEHVGLDAQKPFEKKSELAEGVFVLRDKQSDQEWLSVYFLEYAMASGVPRICSWDTEKFPIGESKIE